MGAVFWGAPSLEIAGRTARQGTQRRPRDGGAAPRGVGGHAGEPPRGQLRVNGAELFGMEQPHAGRRCEWQALAPGPGASTAVRVRFRSAHAVLLSHRELTASGPLWGQRVDPAVNDWLPKRCGLI